MQYIFIVFIICISLICNVKGLSLAESRNIEGLLGRLLISIQGNGDLYEYRMNFHTDSFNKVIDSRFNTGKKSDESITVEKQLDEYPLKLERLSYRFSKDELDAISKLFTESIIGECKTNSIQPIKVLDDKRVVKSTENLMAQTLIISDYQQKYAVLSERGLQKGSGAIIDIMNKEVILPFCGNIVRELSLSPNGQFIAYSIGDVKKFSGSTLLIYNMHERKIILKKDIGEYISSITWNPASDHVALLSKKTRFLSINPLDILSFLAGHPTEYSKFSLRIFDFQKEIKLIKHFANNVKNASSNILWDK